LDTQSGHGAAEPFGRRAVVYLQWGCLLTIVFLVTYGTTNWLAAQRSARLHLYLNWELQAPFLPWMIYPYLSFNLFMAVPLFLLDCARIRAFGKSLLAVTLIAAAFHLVLPAELGWSRPASVSDYPVFDKLFQLDKPHNLVPSLHIGYSFVALAVIWSATKHAWSKALAVAWMAVMTSSVILVHQHHLIDVAGGLALGAVCYGRFSCNRRT
jgi:membrane-associated phospholipid phosphatase